MTKIDQQVLSGVIVITLIMFVAMTTLQPAYAYSIYPDLSDSVFHIGFATEEITGPSAFSDTVNDSINNSKNISNSQANANTTNYNATNSRNIQNNRLITTILANNLEDRLQKVGSVLNMTSQLAQVRNVSFAHLLNQTLNTIFGIPEGADVEKRQIARNILSSYKDLFEIVFLMPNGDVYFVQPYAIQQALTTTNLAFRDYFQGAIETNDVYLGNVITSATGGVRESLMAVPVYSLEDNATLVGVWAGGLDFNVLNEELQSLNLTSDNKRVVYVDYNGQKIADSDIDRSTTPESFANLNSFKNAIINEQSGTVMDKVDGKTMLITYQPVKAFQNTYVVLLMQPP